MANAGMQTVIDRLRRAVGAADGRADDTLLLALFAVDRDPAAFEVLLVRHGPMVRSVCARILRHEQDAEDAFQATFLALAKSAGTIRRGSLAGWLYRAAYHVAIKAKSRAARRKEADAPDDFAADGDTATSAETRELRSIIDEEVTRLPARLRLPVVLCYLEGKSNSDAAAALGCPRGTIDSRLNAGRAKLKARFVRRGIAPAAAAALLERLSAGDAVGSALPATIVRSAARLALAFTSGSAADGVISPAVAVLTHEVLHMVFVSKLKWAGAILLAFGMLGAGGASAYRAMAGDEPVQAAPAARADPKSDAATVAKAVPRTTTRELRRLLTSPAGLEDPIENVTLRDALDLLSKKFNVTIRIDPGSFRRRGLMDPGEDPFKLYDAQVRLPIVRGMTMGEVLADLLAQVRPGTALVTFVVRGSHIAIVPAFVAPFVAQIGAERLPADRQLLNPDLIDAQFIGDPVSVDYEDKPLVEILRELADQTGANIALDNRQKDKGQTPITISLQQVKLYKVLQVMSDMAGLEPVPMHNVYYITTPENAKRLAKREFPQPDEPMPTPGAPPGPTPPNAKQ